MLRVGALVKLPDAGASPPVSLKHRDGSSGQHAYFVRKTSIIKADMNNTITPKRNADMSVTVRLFPISANKAGSQSASGSFGFAPNPAMNFARERLGSRLRAAIHSAFAGSLIFSSSPRTTLLATDLFLSSV